MDRLNSQGIPRQQLLWTLGQRRHVLKALKEDACLLCRKGGLNEAGLCDMCYALLNDNELSAAERWLSGVGP